MSPIRVFLLVIVMLVSVGCSTTGGTIGGLFPAPKFLKGDIKNNTYTAQDKSFSVAVPHKDTSYEYKYMHVKEQYSEFEAYVSFGPAALDTSIYRIQIGKRITPESQSVKLEDVAPIILENYRAQLEKGYGTAPKEEESRQETINGRKAYFWKLSQVIPAGKYMSNSSVTLTHDVYVIDFEKGVAMVWIQIPETANQAEIASRAFAESVVMF